MPNRLPPLSSMLGFHMFAYGVFYFVKLQDIFPHIFLLSLTVSFRLDVLPILVLLLLFLLLFFPRLVVVLVSASLLLSVLNAFIQYGGTRFASPLFFPLCLSFSGSVVNITPLCSSLPFATHWSIISL